MVFKNSKEYQENKLTEDQYIMAMHHTRAFNYESLNEQRQAKEFWRDIVLGIGVVVLSIFCPPAGSESGYKYTTDSLGRISSVEVDDLILETAERNLYSQRTVGGADRLVDDDGGHLIASMFKGSGDIDNLVAMHKDINCSGGIWYEMEQNWRKALEYVPPKKVSVNINAIYDEGIGSLRPSKFEISYQIGNELPRVKIIRNQIGG